MISSGEKRERAMRGAGAVGWIVLWMLLLSSSQADAQLVPGTCPSSLATEEIIAHDFTVSFCELCETGRIELEITNPFRQSDDVDLTELVITENLGSSGLTYLPGSTRFSGQNVTPPGAIEPTVSGPAGSILRWDLSPSDFVLAARTGGGGNQETLVLEFEVVRDASVGEEGLVLADRTIEAAVETTPSCSEGERFTTTTGPGALPLREPEPEVVKLGRNLDAGQGSGSYSDPVYGHAGDDVVWRIEVRNGGQADLQDFLFSDSIVPGNFDIDYVCDSEADATSVAEGGASGGCLAVGGTTDVLGLDVAAVFGGGASPYVVAPAGGSGFFYLVGEIDDSCTNRTNRVFDVEWGCEEQPPAGGIQATSDGAMAADDALLSTRSIESGVDVDVDLTGIRRSQPMGATGWVTIRIANRSGGTIKGGPDGLRLRNVLPAEYVIDPTRAPSVTTSPAYGTSYPGMIDTIAWTNPAPDTFPLVTADPALPLSNTELELELTSSTVHPDFPATQRDMIRHGDVVTVRFRTVLIDPSRYDRVANLDVRQESPSSDPPDTDPSESFSISNRTEVWWEEFCTATEHQRTVDEVDTARPEDLDVDVVGSELVFILTNTGDPLPLRVALRNDGGHDAEDYEATVTFGEAMVVQTVPAGCSPTSNPPARPAWQIPVDLPSTASVYRCDRGRIAPGETEVLDFEVVKNEGASFEDDLTFRVDVVGEITLSDGTPLWFPSPTPRADGVTDRANDYSVDALWSRVIGYNLFKDQVGVCTENNPPPGDPDDQIQIGEECSFQIESGGWFGFETPGFTYIAVQDVQVVDQLPDGQGYVSSTDPLATSTPAIQGVSLNPPPLPLEEQPFDWTFNSNVPSERITEKDHWFRVGVTTRLLNDPIDTRASPNEHAAISANVMTSTFEAVFFNQISNEEEVFLLGPSTIGFPREVHRRVDLTVTEPELIVTKEVCNETRFGFGPSCSNFVPLADDGDAFDSYVYRITVENEATRDGIPRAPAYDVTVTSVTDPSDQLFVRPLPTDGLDNDADLAVDAGDAGGEGSVTDDVLRNGIPAQVIASYTHSDRLRRIDAGESVALYYRVDPDDDVAPLQRLVSSATASYDSLEGESGSQSAPLGGEGESGGARRYVSAPGEATIRIIPVEVGPKQILRVSSSAASGPGIPQPVAIGEEVEFQLRALVPVARLRDFVIRDELPPGLSCAEAPEVDLDAPPYDAAGFVPGGTHTPTCTASEAVWSFGDQTVTRSNRVDRRFDFRVGFIARVGNEPGNQDGSVLRNGGSSTLTEVRYVDEADQQVVLSIGEAAVQVQEPLLELTEAFSVPTVDAGDRPRVTVTLTNTGSATAYNPRVLDDLSSPELDYVGDVAGDDPPSVDLTTLGPDRPIFSWAPGFSIAPGETIRFSFAVEVDLTVEPEQILGNRIEADWTSLAGRTTALNRTGSIGPDGSATGMRIGSLPNAGDPLNDYEATVRATVPVAPVAVGKSDLSSARAPEIGAHKEFEIEIALPEGTIRDLRVEDALDSGSVSYVLADDATYDIRYEFVDIVSLDGAPPDESALSSVPSAGARGVATWSIGTVVTASEDDVAGGGSDPAIRIRYFARIENDLATSSGSTLQNTATVHFLDGETGDPASVSAMTAPVTAIEPALTATKVLTNVTPGKTPAAPPAFGDTLQYVVTFVNGGNATAYDVNVVDTLPPELSLSSGLLPTATIDSVSVSGFVGMPSGGPGGPLVWGRENADDSLDIPPGSFLELTYQVEVDGPPADGATLENSVFTDWTSLEVDPGQRFERTGVGCPSTTPPNDYCYGPAIATGTVDPAPPSSPVRKENTQSTAAVGEVFRYRLTVPETPYGFPAYDVRIYDDLTASAADLRFLNVRKVSGSGAWVPSNTGTETSLVLEDPDQGIDIPAGEQVVLEIEVVLEDTPTNVGGLQFTNSASYLYNWLDGNAATQRVGALGTSPPMTIVEPDVVTLEKSGPATMSLGTAATFTLNVHNASEAPAWSLEILDRLADAPNASVCATPPADLTARVFESDGATPVSEPLVEGTDFSVVFEGEPVCELRLAMQTPAATVGPGERLLVTYRSELDADSLDGESLVNVAGAVRWWSADGTAAATAGDRRVFERSVTDGTVGVLDHEDAHESTVALPRVRFEKTVLNVTRNEDPATAASPGDTLRYRLFVENLRDAPLEDLSIVDELDGLNAVPAFEPGTLRIVSAPAGADASGTDARGGTAGTGRLEVGNLSLSGANDSVLVELEVTLAGVLPDGTEVRNQSTLSTRGILFAQSDDPAVNGEADPLTPGDEDPTVVPIESAPVFQVEKTSAYVTGDPDVLLAGETLRYTITVTNIGDDDAVDTTIRDAVPVNAAYVPGSTTLNGLPVQDDPGGVLPLSDGLAISAPEEPTPGLLRAGDPAEGGGVATLIFDVVVDADVVDGTVVSNQAFVSAPRGGVGEQPSDDPRTPLPGDPTRDVVGNAPLLFAPKSVTIETDLGTPGVVDPGDVLRYRITVYNSGAAEATAVRLRDDVPPETTYVADSLTLDGLPVGQPDGGVSPLVQGIAISSSELVPPLPPPDGGRIRAGENAVVTFALRVNDGVPGGTIIRNQALVESAELPGLRTDGDGDPATGPEPTLVVVGAGQQLAISKEVTVVGGGPALAGSELEYLVRVQNIGSTPASDVVLTDDLDQPVAGQLAYVAGSATLNGAPDGVRVAGSVLTADASSLPGPLAPGESLLLRFRAVLAADLEIGTTVVNTATVQWGMPAQTASASVSIDVGGTPGIGALNGSAWHDADHDRERGAGEQPLEGWWVELLRNGRLVQSVRTDASGGYRITGIAPNDGTGDTYQLRFRAPGAGPRTASLGRTRSAFTDGLQSIEDIRVPAGSNLQDLDLPIDPNGSVYDAVLRTPVSGATLRLVEAGSGQPVSGSCFDDPEQQGQVTVANGFYKFDLNFADASCPSGGVYRIEVTAPGAGFVSGVSQIIPPSVDASGAAFSVPACPGSALDAIPLTAQHCEIQPSERAPAPSARARTGATRYHLLLAFDGSGPPGSSQVFNNHLPLDPALGGAVAITKTTPSLNVSRGDLVPYEITFDNGLPVPLEDLSLVDRYPAGFRYIEGSARIDGVPVEPTIQGRELVWTDVGVDALASRSVVLLLGVGAGVREGEFVNRAQAFSSVTGLGLSGEASATVRVVPDPTFDCTDVLGKVFDDRNRDGIQDAGENGIAGVRLMTVRGLAVTTDPEGRFHITCAVVPDETRGSNFVLKLDDRSLPSGYRMSTRQTQVQRATRGKALRFRFGASIHRVVGLDVADPVFVPGETSLRAQWRPRIERLLDELEKGGGVLRLSYVADVEASRLVDRRLEALKKLIRAAWEERRETPLEIETEVFWRRGGPSERSTAPIDPGSRTSRLPPVGAGPPGLELAPGRSVERSLPVDEPITRWSVDPERIEEEVSDRLEEREVSRPQVETVKRRDVVPPIRFESGEARIPADSIERLRAVLDEMQSLPNVRLHLVGHADDQPLSPDLARLFGDNEGLSRERAGEVAELLQEALSLPPESISYSWAGASRPVAPNESDRGQALNRRVEVEVWYDEIEETTAVEEVVVPEDFKRVKVCRTETVCRLRYRVGHERRTRLRNLVPPLDYGEEVLDVPQRFLDQIEEALGNLRDERNVTVKLVGHTDDVPLEGRAERLYGNHLALSKARARRVALSVKERLGLPSSAIDSDGRGADRPVASNATARGRALNRRVEVEFWHDDPLLELPDEPVICPDRDGAELVTYVYDPPEGRFDPLPVVDGEVTIPSELPERLRRAMAALEGKSHVRLRFIGYTANERLSRRMAGVYGDDIGLSAARARRAMERIQSQLDLEDFQVEHEGRGYVHAEDVVNGGFVQGESSHVVVQVVYDELGLIDDHEGIEITPITRELRPRDALSLNLMRITVDGEPVDDPGRSSADIQRCTDVALDSAAVQFRFDDLEAEPRLSVSSDPATVSPGSNEPVRFRMYSNYPHYIERAEVRIFERQQSLESEPLAVLELDRRGFARWRPGADEIDESSRHLKFVLRAYGEDGRFDQTAPQSLWVDWTAAFEPFDLIPFADEPSHGSSVTRAPSDVQGGAGTGAEDREDETRDPVTARRADADAEAETDTKAEAEAETDADADVETDAAPDERALLAGYGESEPTVRNIALGSKGTVRVSGSGIPAAHSVWLAGTELPVNDQGEFVGEVLLPPGMHTVEVAVLDPEGNGELFLRDLELERDDWFFVGIADLTLSADLSDGPPDVLGGENGPDRDSFADGRLAFFTRGKFGEDWKLMASADTREGPVESLFSNFMDKSPRQLFRRLDTDYYYPTFGDDSTVEEMAPTLGKFYVKLSKRDNHLLWGNFTVRYADNELALVERGLYGANARYQSLDTTRFGERRIAIDGFAADPGTVSSREEFRGTGGSVYFLNRRDLLVGSERLRVEVRDKASGLVSEVIRLQPELDYDIDYIQGRVLLSEPLSAIADDSLLVRNDGLSGNEVWLVVQYEFTPGFEEVDALNLGGQGHYWLSDFVKLGVTANRNEEDGVDNSLYAADLTFRKNTRTWLKIQAGRTEGLVSTSQISGDGGFTFDEVGETGFRVDDAYGYRVDLSIGFADVLEGAGGQISLYGQRLEAGYSAPGLNARSDTDQYGGLLQMPILDSLDLTAKADRTVEDRGLVALAAEADLDYRVSEHWSLRAGVRHDEREDRSVGVVATQEQGDRTDAVLQVELDTRSRWRAYAFGQGTVHATGQREENHRGGIGGAVELSDRISIDGEVSHGDLGPAAQVGTTYQHSERAKLYMTYALDNERGFDGLHERRGSLVLGTRSRLGDSASVYVESQYQHASVTGLTRSMGVDYAPTERWTIGVSWEDGTTRDRRTNAETERRAGGASVGYRFEGLEASAGVEYIFNETEQSNASRSERTTWLFRNNLKYQIHRDGRLLAKLNHAISESSRGDFFDGGFTEAVVGFAYRPVAHDRLSALVKYTYFFNVPATDQVGQQGVPALFVQKSQIAAIDLSYDLTDSWTIGAKYAYRLGQVSVDREDPDFFDNDAHLAILRVDWRFLGDWESSVEGRILELPDLDERRAGALVTLYRYFGEHFKVGVGYNFTDFSEDLTDLGFDHHGVFFNVVGTF